MARNRPEHVEIKKDRGMTIRWRDGSTSFYSVATLRRMSPSADMRELREQMRRNPLTVLPASAQGGDQPLRIDDAEFVGNYAIRLRFSDGHETGIYSWDYLQDLEPDPPA